MAGNKKVNIDEEKVIEMYNNGEPYAKIATTLEVSEAKVQRTVTKLIKARKIERRGYKRFNPNPKIDLDEDAVVDYFKQGNSTKNVGKKFKISERTARDLIKDWFETNSTIEEYYNIVNRNRLNATNAMRINISRDELIAMKEKGLSNRKIAEYFGISHTTVAKELERIAKGI